MASPSRRIGPVAAKAAAGLVLVVTSGCSGDSPSASSLPASPAPVAGTVQSVDQLPLVDQIAPAIAAVERKLGMAQQFFEINATPQRVNLFVAMNNATVVQAFAFENGALTWREPQSGASGNTFPASAVDIATETAFSAVRDQLPGSLIRAVEVVGTAAGTARYSVVVNSSGGAPLVIEIDRRGAIIGTDLGPLPSNPAGSLPA